MEKTSISYIGRFNIFKIVNTPQMDAWNQYNLIQNMSSVFNRTWQASLKMWTEKQGI